MKPCNDALIASEALYGFAGWITSRDEPVTASSRHDTGVWAELVNEYIKTNSLSEPRPGWVHRSPLPASSEIEGLVPGEFVTGVKSMSRHDMAWELFKSSMAGAGQILSTNGAYTMADRFLEEMKKQEARNEQT